MKIKITKDGEIKEIEMKGMKGKSVDKLFNKLIEVESSESPGAQSVEFLAMVKDEASKISGMSVDELDDLDSDERDKIMRYVSDKVMKNLDFIRPSTS